MSEQRSEYVFSHDAAKYSAIHDMTTTPTTGEWEWIKRPAHTSKTLAQLGGLFGCWIKYLSKELGESEDYLHRRLKAQFLARIYVTEPANAAQEQWVELLAIYQEKGEIDKLERHAKRISLSWANINQTREYMNAIEHHYQCGDHPLPILDKFRRAYAA